MPIDHEQSSNPKLERRRALWTWACGASPWVLLVLIILLAIHVRLGLGHWPRPMWETYETTAFNFHMLAVWSVAWLSLFVAPPVWLVLLWFRRFRLSLPVHLLQVTAFGGGWITLDWLSKHDPTPFTRWFLD